MMLSHDTIAANGPYLASKERRTDSYIRMLIDATWRFLFISLYFIVGLLGFTFIVTAKWLVCVFSHCYFALC